MPIIRTNKDYISRIKHELLQHYGIHAKDSMIKSTLDQFSRNMRSHLINAHQIQLPYGNTIEPVTPLFKNTARKYYKIDTIVHPQLYSLCKLARQSSYLRKYTDPQAVRPQKDEPKPWENMKPLYMSDNEADKPLI